jgi:hypothetical protein
MIYSLMLGIVKKQGGTDHRNYEEEGVTEHL